MGQFAGDQVNADRVSYVHGQDDVEDGQGPWGEPGLRHGLLQTLRLVSRRVCASHAVVGLGQDRLDLHVLVASQRGTEEVLSTHWSSEVPWDGDNVFKVNCVMVMLS